MIGQFGSAWQIAFSFVILLLIILYVRYSFFRIIANMELVAETIEGYLKDAEDTIVKSCEETGGNGDPRRRIRRSFEFFLISPVDLDPYGILRKLEYLLDQSEDRFKATAKSLAPEGDEVTLANINTLLKGGVGLNNLAKIVRHYVEFIRRTNNYQLAMVFQMNIPIIKKIGKAQSDGVKAIAEGRPMGDSIGPLVAANLMSSPCEEVARDVVASRENIRGHEVIVLKANGPGANLGKLGLAVEKLAAENRVSKIITVDAALKLEGERTGSVAEGVGAAIGDPGPEKARIEEAALKLEIPLEAIGIKMGIEEAIMGMIKEVHRALPEARRRVEESIGEAPDDRPVMVVGVGNTAGVGNLKSEAEEIPVKEKEEEKEELSLLDRMAKKLAEKQMRAERERMKAEKKAKEKKKEKEEKKDSSTPEE